MKVIIVLILSLYSVVSAADSEIRDKNVKELESRIEMLEKQVDLLDKMIAQNTDLIKTNRQLNDQVWRLLKALHPQELRNMK